MADNGQIVSIDMKKLNQKYVIDLFKKVKNLEEQNNYLSQYL